MKKLLAVALLSAAAATPAVAADQAYVGVDVGSSSIPGGSGNSYGALVGYKLDKSATRFMGQGSLAFEGQYTHLGSYTWSFPPFSESVSFSSIGVNAVAMFPIPSAKNLSVFGKLGLDSVSVSCSNCSGFYSSSTGIDFGFGAEYAIDNHVAVRAGYQTYATSSTDTFYIAGIYSF